LTKSCNKNYPIYTKSNIYIPGTLKIYQNFQICYIDTYQLATLIATTNETLTWLGSKEATCGCSIQTAAV